MSNQTPHVLVVGPCADCEPFTDDMPNGYRCDRRHAGDSWRGRHQYKMTIECPGASGGSCLGYRECATAGCPLHYLDGTAEARDAADDGETVHHGVEHHPIDGSWMVGTGRCYLRELDYFQEEAADLPGVRPGARVPFHHTYEGDGVVVLEPAEPMHANAGSCDAS